MNEARLVEALGGIKAEMAEIRTDVKWIKRFFWLGVGTATANGAAFLLWAMQLYAQTK